MTELNKTGKGGMDCAEVSGEVNLEAIYIEVTNQCNLRCTTCPRTFYHDKDRPRALQLKEAEDIFEQVPRDLRVILHGLGEPLLNAQIADIVKLAKSYGHYVLFNTNATLLDRKMSLALIEAGLDELRISVDIPDPDIYRKIRQGAELDDIIRNTRTLVDERDRSTRISPRVSFWMTALKSHLFLLPDLLKLAAEINVSEVYLQRLVFFGDGLAVEDESIYGKDDDYVASVLDRAGQVAAEVGVRLWGAGNATPKEAFAVSGDGALLSRPWSICSRPFRIAYVTVNGNLLPCCIAPFSSASSIEQHVLGNIFRESFEEIWKGKRYAEFRRAFQSDDPWECCRRCGVSWSP